jgi:hypothetical protein
VRLYSVDKIRESSFCFGSWGCVIRFVGIVWGCHDALVEVKGTFLCA